MTLSEYWAAMDAVFGPGFSRVLHTSQVLPELGFRTPADAIDAGVRPQDAWRVLCDAMAVLEPDRWRHADL